MDAAKFAARRRELLKNRLEVRKDIGEDRLRGQEGLGGTVGAYISSRQGNPMSPKAKKTVLL